MSATAKFYAGFILALALVVAVSYDVGVRAGRASAAHEARTVRALP